MSARDSFTPDQNITIPSMSLAGDSLYLCCTDCGSMNIGIETDEGSHSAYFDREQQLKLRDWLNKVLA